MKKSISIVLCAAFICIAFWSCSSGMVLHETPQVYVLSGEDEFTLMPTVTLYENGNGRLSQPMISSLSLFDMGHYQIKGNELTVSHSGNANAIFTISDNGDTLTLQSTNVGFTKVGSVYKYRSSADYLKSFQKIDGEKLTLEVLTELAKKSPDLTSADFENYEHIHLENDPDRNLFNIEDKYTLQVTYSADGETFCTVERNSSGESFPLHLNGSTGLVFDEFLGIIETPKYETQEWLNYFSNDLMPWDETKELTIKEFPDTTFTWTPYGVSSGDKEAFSGMPVWNVYLDDLTNDGKPELCSTVSFGSGLIDERIIVYDYTEDKTYTLVDRGKYNFHLSMNNGTLMVTRIDYLDSDGTSGVTTELRLVNGEILCP